MTSQKEMVIELSKGKLFLQIFGCFAFVALGIWMLTLDSAAIESLQRYNNPMLIYFIGAVSIICFGLFGAIGFKSMFDKGPGLILSHDGFTDHASGISVGSIQWSDVVEIAQCQIGKQKFVSIHVEDPEKYLNRGSFLKKMVNRSNLKTYGTPIIISANTLKTTHAALLSSFEEYFRESHS